MKAKEIMTPDPHCIGPDTSLTEAARQMRMLDVDILPVYENDCLVGTVTDHDITVRAVAEGLDPKTVKVRQMMTPEVVDWFGNQNFKEDAHLMEEKQIRRPALNGKKRRVGIVPSGNSPQVSTKGNWPAEYWNTLRNLLEPFTEFDSGCKP